MISWPWRSSASFSPSPFSIADKQRGTEAAHFAAEFECLLDQQWRTHRAERLVQAADDRADVDSGRRCLDQHAGIDGRIEQGKLAHDAFDVHAVADLEQPVGHRIPVAEQLVVGRDAEVECASDAEQRSGGVRIVACVDGRLKIERKLAFEIDQRIADRVETFSLSS